MFFKFLHEAILAQLLGVCEVKIALQSSRNLEWTETKQVN